MWNLNIYDSGQKITLATSTNERFVTDEMFILAHKLYEDSFETGQQVDFSDLPYTIGLSDQLNGQSIRYSVEFED